MFKLNCKEEKCFVYAKSMLHRITLLSKTKNMCSTNSNLAAFANSTCNSTSEQLLPSIKNKSNILTLQIYLFGYFNLYNFMYVMILI